VSSRTPPVSFGQPGHLPGLGRSSVPVLAFPPGEGSFGRGRRFATRSAPFLLAPTRDWRSRQPGRAPRAGGRPPGGPALHPKRRWSDTNRGGATETVGVRSPASPLPASGGQQDLSPLEFAPARMCFAPRSAIAVSLGTAFRCHRVPLVAYLLHRSVLPPQVEGQRFESRRRRIASRVTPTQGQLFLAFISHA